MKKNYFAILVFGGILISSANAAVPSVNPRPRTLSMGGAGLAAMGNADSASVNPAGLADIEDGKIEAFPLTMEVPFEVDMLSSYLDFKDKIDASGATDEIKQAALSEFLGDVGSQSLGVRMNLYPNYTRKYMHFGFLVDAYGEPRLRMGGITANQAIETRGTAATLGLVLAGAYSFLEDQLQVGVTLKPLYRSGIVANDKQNLYDIVKGDNANTTIQKQLLGENWADNRGYGVGADIGVKYFLPVLQEMKPSVGATYQDIGNTRFIGDTQSPSDIPQSLSVGAAIHPNYSIFKNTFALDFRNILEASEFLNKFHIGAESVIWDLLALRFGLSQGYVTGGVGVLLKFFEMDAFIANREASRYAHTQDITTVGMRLSFGW